MRGRPASSSCVPRARRMSRLSNRCSWSASARRRAVAEWRWRWFGAEGGHGEVLILESDGLAIGHWAGSITDMWLDQRRKRLMLGGESHGATSVPAARRHGHAHEGGTGDRRRPRRRVDRIRDRPGCAPERCQRRRRSVIGRMPSWMVWPKRVPRLPAPLGVLAARLLAGWRAIVFGLLPCADVEVLGAVAAAEVDELAAAAAAYAACMRIRDSAYLRWRWFERAEGHVTVLSARTAGRLSGYAVVGVESDDGRRIGRVLDLLATDKTSLAGCCDVRSRSDRRRLVRSSRATTSIRARGRGRSSAWLGSRADRARPSRRFARPPTWELRRSCSSPGISPVATPMSQGRAKLADTACTTRRKQT